MNKQKRVGAIKRLIVCSVIGIIVGAAVGWEFSWKFAPIATWDVGAAVFLLWVWLTLRNSTQARTEALASQEDAGRAAADVLITLASVASLAAVAVLLIQSQDLSRGAMQLQVALGILSVVISWTTIHTIHTLQYADRYYAKDSGIDFNNNAKPKYSDFAYIAFTVGMTFQVSDTSFSTSEMRSLALKHALLSYLFGTVIFASTINLLASLIK